MADRAEFPVRICRRCNEPLPMRQFAINRKDGKEYRLHTCNGCRHAGNIRKRDCDENRQFNSLVRWSPPPLVERHGTGISE